MTYIETNPKGFVSFTGGKTGLEVITMHTDEPVEVPDWLSVKLLKNPAFAVDEEFTDEAGEETGHDNGDPQPKRRGRPRKYP